MLTEAATILRPGSAHVGSGLGPTRHSDRERTGTQAVTKVTWVARKNLHLLAPLVVWGAPCPCVLEAQDPLPGNPWAKPLPASRSLIPSPGVLSRAIGLGWGVGRWLEGRGSALKTHTLSEGLPSCLQIITAAQWPSASSQEDGTPALPRASCEWAPTLCHSPSPCRRGLRVQGGAQP